MNRRHCLFLQASQFGSPRTCYVPGRMKVRWAFDPPVLRAIRVFTKEIRSFNPKGNQSWILIGRNDAEPPVLWSPDVKSRFIGKHLDAGKDWRQVEKGMTEDETAGWYHQLGGHEFEQAPGDGGEGSLACCSPWGHKELDTTEWLNNTIKYKSNDTVGKQTHVINITDTLLPTIYWPDLVTGPTQE